MSKKPSLICHRGASAYAPENTNVSFHTAADMDAKWVEMDVTLTKDKIPVIFHDGVLERTTNGTGLIHDLTLEEVKKLDAGSWFSESFYDTNISTLEEALDVILERDLSLNLEIKPAADQEKETSEIALDLITRIWDDPKTIMLSSFQAECLAVAQDYAPDYERSLFIRSFPPELNKVFQNLGLKTVSLEDHLANEVTIKGLHRDGYKVNVWTVNDPIRAEQLIEWDIDYLTTDKPDLLE